MALLTPLWQQAAGGDTAVAYTASAYRQFTEAAFDEGVVDQDDLKVVERAAGGPNRSVDVGVGQAAIAGDDTTGQGVYVCTNTTVVNVPITAAPASGFRIDRIVARIRDSGETGDGLHLYEWQITVLNGTNNAGALATLGASTVELARVRVNSTTTIITNASGLISDMRPQARKAMWTARTAAPRLGNTAISTENKFEFWNGSAWITSDDNMMTAAADAQNAWFGGTPPAAVGGYKILADYVPAGLTCLSGGCVLTLPFTFAGIIHFHVMLTSDAHVITATRRTLDGSATFAGNKIPLRVLQTDLSNNTTAFGGTTPPFSYMVIGW